MILLINPLGKGFGRHPTLGVLQVFQTGFVACPLFYLYLNLRQRRYRKHKPHNMCLESSWIIDLDVWRLYRGHVAATEHGPITFLPSAMRKVWWARWREWWEPWVRWAEDFFWPNRMPRFKHISDPPCPLHLPGAIALEGGEGDMGELEMGECAMQWVLDTLLKPNKITLPWFVKDASR